MKKVVLLLLMIAALAGCEDLPIGDIGEGRGEGGGGDDFTVSMHHQTQSSLPYAAGPVIAPGSKPAR